MKHEFQEQLNRKSLKYNWHDAEGTVLEGVMARGDRKVGAVIEEAYHLGCLFDSWTESFRSDLWMQAFENTGVDIDFYNLREREAGRAFPLGFHRYRREQEVFIPGVGARYERRSDAELPDAVFRLRRGKIRRRCLL